MRAPLPALPARPDLQWSPVDVDADQVLRAQVATRYDGAVLTGRLCGRCGSSEHGRPWARAGDREVPVSLSRSGPHLVTVVGEVGGPGLGVDVEAVRSDWSTADLLAPGEQAADDLAAARLWAAKEAILKAAGTGLARPMSTLVVADYAGTLWEPAPPPDYVVVVASGR